MQFQNICLFISLSIIRSKVSPLLCSSLVSYRLFAFSLTPSGGKKIWFSETYVWKGRFCFIPIITLRLAIIGSLHFKHITLYMLSTSHFWISSQLWYFSQESHFFSTHRFITSFIMKLLSSLYGLNVRLIKWDFRSIVLFICWIEGCFWHFV